MIKELECEHKFFSTEEAEAQQIIDRMKEETKGEIIKQQIAKRHHPNYGDYFETIIKEQFTTSKSILETGA